MKRRAFCHAVAAVPLVASMRVSAQSRPPTVRVAWASIERASTTSPYLAAFRAGMREVGYSEGSNLTLDAWWGEGTAARLQEQVDAIVRSQPTVIVAQGGLALQPLLAAEVKIPIVFGVSVDPVEAKIAQSYARPGGNATGMTFFALDLVGKRLQIMREALPHIRRVALLADPQHPGQNLELAAAQAAGSALGLQLSFFPVHSEAELEAALAAIASGGYDAILAFADGFTQSYAGRIAAFSLDRRIPAVDGWSPFARQGNLMIYGPVLEDCYRRLAVYVDKIARGARPGDLPIELPTKVELVINLRTAKALNLVIPPAVLQRADEIIQ